MDNGEKMLLKNMGKSIENGFLSVNESIGKVHKRIDNVKDVQAKMEAKQSAANVLLGTIKDVVTKHVDNEDIHFKKELVSDHMASKEVHFTKTDFREDQRKRRRETVIFFATLCIAWGGIAIWFLKLAEKAFAK